jgi:hypothetical protein
MFNGVLRHSRGVNTTLKVEIKTNSTLPLGYEAGVLIKIKTI